MAHEVGVSVMTVSNVVNGNLDRVSPETARRVDEAVERLGYVPNAAARSLAGQRSRLVGVLVPEARDDRSLLASPHHVDVIGAVEAELRRHDHHLLLRAVATRQDVLESVRRWGLDGVVVLGCTEAVLATLDLPSGVPAVVVDSYADDPRLGYIRSDDRTGGRLAGEHLLDLGHERVAFAGPLGSGSRVVHERLAGLQDALADRGIDPAAVVTLDAPTTYADGVTTGTRIAAAHPQVTAVFATADILAAGLCRGLGRAGRQVPRDVSVLGYDDADLAEMVTPQLSTVAQDSVGKGVAAARLVLAMIDGDGPRAVAPGALTLVHRESTGPRRSVTG
ncbi:LacI family DNA-binding transcriptional regulator [Cellulomonas sp. P24]|uniref:LacI family DNA-binding transcriptional regulator n=1 Tax=Cellulomonas sp. P24 TaxID=2885206 RepID=UPI00216AEED0|nr:LacI family DNA-binding transcriptional regulator [Cellulomonas sp. P24]MCR6493676.1 LacI family transcriptional regulator [Cellulomonas sp. P24]